MSFATLANKRRVEEGCPWLFDNHIFLIESFDGFTQLRHIKFAKVAFWVQLHNLLMAGMNQYVGEKIRGSLGIVVVDVDEEVIGWGHYLRVKVIMDLEKSIA